MELKPTKAESRAIVLTVETFWLGSGIGFVLLEDSVLLLPLVLVSMAAGFAFYVIVYRIAGRELDRPARSFWFPWGVKREFRQPFGQRAAEGYGVLFKLMNPMWWHRAVAPATGWPVLLVDSVILLGLLAALFAGPVLA